MDRHLFSVALAASAQKAWALAASMVSEDLPTPLVFRVRLNQSYDGHALQLGEVLFPADSSADRGVALHRCDAATVVAELWRDGRVPEWINVAVVGETGVETVIELVCCGRFTDDDALLYHHGEGAPPFHVVSPVLPPSYDGTPFSIHTRTECWDSADLDHLVEVSGNVWSFELMAEAFDDSQLCSLPDLPQVEIFEHHACTLGRDAMSAFARFPQLRVLRLHLREPSNFHISQDDDHLDSLTNLTITNLPARPWGHDALAEVAPIVRSMILTAGESLWLNGGFGPLVRDIDLTATTVTGPTRLPTCLDRLSIRLTHGTDQHVSEMLDEVTVLKSLSLRGTAVSDAIVPVLERYDLTRLDLVDTAVSASALSRFRINNPETDLFPRTPPFPASDVTIYDAAPDQP